MNLHDELLDTARRLVGGTPPADADLRRCISTAYYALFHRLIDAAVAHFLPNHTPDQRAGLARSFEHTKMKGVCERVISLAKQRGGSSPPTPTARILGSVIPPELERLADSFKNLQQQRSEADYDRLPPTTPVTLVETQRAIARAESSFADWAQLEAANPAVAQAFLVLLLVGEPKPR